MQVLSRPPSGWPALVLNADYRPLSYYPLSLWPWQETIKAVFLGRVDVVSTYDKKIHSPSFEMALPSLMKHVRILEISGLVASEKNGRVRTCSLRTEALATLEVWLAAQREIWEQRLDRMEMYVEKLKKEEKSNAR